MENDEQLHKWLNGELNPEEEKDFKQRPEYDALEKIKSITDRMAVPAFEEDKMLADILAQDKSPSAKIVNSQKRFRQPWLTYAAAAAVLLLLGFFFLRPTNEPVHYQTASGERLEGILPDGSTFILNAESQLSYDAGDWDKDRRLLLEGEAFFKVEKGEQFSVNTSNGLVVVLGTAFNVWSRKQTLEVKCQHGRVGVAANASLPKEELIANQAIRYTDGELVERWEEPAGNAGSWQEGVSRFRKQALESVLAELERQYGVKIINGTIDTSVIVSCNFTHNDLNQALKTCLQPLPVNYRIEGGVVYLSQKE